MKKLALIHTVRPGYLRFGDEIAAALPNVNITNTLDEFLAKEAVEQGISPHLSNRFLMTAQLAESTGADLIVCACTSMIPIIDSVRPFLRVPIILIDDEMHRCAPLLGDRVTIFATAESALAPTVQKYKDSVERQGAGKKQISTLVCAEANAYMRTGNMEEHDRLVLEAAKSIKDTDLIILSQYSITHLKAQMENICGCKVIGSGEYCIQEIARILGEEVAFGCND